MQFEFNNSTFNIKIWSREDGNIGPFVTIDTETEMVDKWTETPNIATFQAYGGGEDSYYVRYPDIQRFLDLHKDSTLIAQNAPFDVDVIHKFAQNTCLFHWYDNNQIRDTRVMYQLLHLASAGFSPFRGTSLADMSKKFLGVELDKDIEVRGGFGQFIGKPIEDIPEKYLIYGMKDVIATYQLHNILLEHIKKHDRYNTLLSLDIQVKGDLALNAMYKNGIHFDLDMRDKWLAKKDIELTKLGDSLANWGLIRGVAGYKAQYKKIIVDILRLDVPYRYKKLECVLHKDNWIYAESGRVEIKGRNVKVEEGQDCHGEPSISSQREDLLPFIHEPFVSDYLDFQSIEHATSFVRNIDSEIVHPRYNLIKNTGRTSCTNPNFQQLPKMGGIREMFKAKEGHTFIITDYSAVELATLAQVLYSTYGESVMRNKINEGLDLHKYYGTIYYKKSIDKITKEERQTCKAPNFGFPGGLGPKTFVQFSKGYGLDLTLQEARVQKETWFDAYPETRDYMRDEQGFVYTLTGRKRGRTTYCAEKNTPFQGLSSDGCKLALYGLLREGFVLRAFVHDEIVCEAPKERAEELLKVQEEIMIARMKEVCPDVNIAVESMISPHYTK